MLEVLRTSEVWVGWLLRGRDGVAVVWRDGKCGLVEVWSLWGRTLMWFDVEWLELPTWSWFDGGWLELPTWNWSDGGWLSGILD